VNRLPRGKNPFNQEAVDSFTEFPLDPTNTEKPIELATNPTQAAVPVEFFSQMLAMFAEKMNEGIRESIKAAREVPIDPIKEAQKARAAKTKKDAEEAHWSQLQARFLQCSHLRDDGSSCICWAMQSDNVQRGYCPHCYCVFSPLRQECSSQEVFEKYKDVVRLPTRTGNSVLYI
jgi:hypothetical protein